MPVTLEQIAERAGVAPTTVSRSLNAKLKGNRPAIARRIERIQRIAEEMGYQPNSAARSTATGRFNQMAFVMCRDTGSNWLPQALILTLSESVEAMGHRLVLSTVEAATMSQPDFIPHLLRTAAVDALMVMPNAAFTPEMRAFFERRDVPIVWINERAKQRSIYPDDHQGAELAVQRLVARGHRHLTYFARSDVHTAPIYHYSETDRFHGFQSAMNAAGLDANRVFFTFPGEHQHVSLEKADELLDQFPDTTAVLCYGQSEALTLHAAAVRRGRKVPGDLEIIAFGEANHHWATGLPLQTMIVPFAAVAQKATEMIKAMLEGEAEPPSVAVPFEWTEG